MLRPRLERSLEGLAILWLLALMLPVCVDAGTTGKIAGLVLDQTGLPIVDAVVALEGKEHETVSDAEGHYDLLNIPSGTYQVNVSRAGFRTLRVQDVIVSADQTTQLTVELERAAIDLEEVVVTAERLPIALNLTSTQATLTSADIEVLPVQELDDVVNLQAGVVDGHFRGGRRGEVQYQVDGVSVNNAYDNSSSLRVDRSLLQEVQVISGTFDAEYGQAMSGVVNAVLKQGTEDFQWGAELFAGGFVYPGNDGRLTDDSIRPGAIENYQVNLSGPLVTNTVYLLSGRRYVFDDYVYGIRRFKPTDRSDFERKIFDPTGDAVGEPLGYTHEWSGLMKITNTSIPNVKLSYQAIANRINARRSNYEFRFNPDGLSKQHTSAIVHGLDWTQNVSPSTYFDVSLRQNYFEYDDNVYEDLFDARYDAAGPPRGDENYEYGAIVQGVELTRFRQRTNTYLAKGSLVTQWTREHQIKVGGEFQLPRVQFGATGHLIDTGLELERHLDEPPDFIGIREYHPVIAAAFAQDQIEWSDFTLRAGCRMDYFDARSTIPSDLANPANAIAGAPESVPQPTTTKVSLAPRFGLAYPITERAAVHLAYGHFYQFPSIGQVFSNADYAVLARLQAGRADYGVLGNPDVKPEKTVQYEFGYKHAVTSRLGVDFNIFYKDIRDLLGVEFVSTYNDAEYARLTNTDFGNVIGFTVAVDQRNLGPASFALDYTWQLAQGNSSDPRETATRASAGEDPRPRQVPFSWDQRHTFNMTVSLAEYGVYAISSVLRVASGQPYTPIIESGFGYGLETNSERKPAGVVLDLRAEKQMRVRGRRMGLFLRVFNLLDTRYFNGPVFNSTGSPYYSRFPGPDAELLLDPTRFYPPRRIELGMQFGSGT